jgi:hypothetical protein
MFLFLKVVIVVYAETLQQRSTRDVWNSKAEVAHKDYIV